MPSLQLQITKQELKELRGIWKINKSNLRREVMKRMGWNKLEDFCADVFRYGMDKVSENPKMFIELIRSDRDPIFKRRRKHKSPLAVKKLEDEFKKAYI
jgi:hypothetical protein